MRKSLIVLALAGTMTLGGCAGFGGRTVDSKFIVEVKAFSTTLCGYVPTTATVKELFENGYATTVAAIANIVCDAVRPLLQVGARRGKYVPRVGNVVVRGYWAK